MRRPKVTLKCPADAFHGPNERTIEFSSPGPMNGGNDIGGGLINIRRTEDGEVRVCVYRTDPSVVVQVGSGVRWQMATNGCCVEDPLAREKKSEEFYDILDQIPPHAIRRFIRLRHQE